MTGTLAARLWPVEAGNATTRAIVLIVAGSLLLTLSAKVQVPFWPVPMTMQTFVVLMIGATYGSTLGAATVLVYLVQGALGLPVFAKGGGLAYMTGPTGGYLLGWRPGSSASSPSAGSIAGCSRHCRCSLWAISSSWRSV